MMMTQVRLAVAALALAGLAAVAPAQTQYNIAYTDSPVPGYSSYEPDMAGPDGVAGYTAGWTFTVNSSIPLIVKKLGSDATNTSDTPVAIYDMTTGALLASATVPAGSTDPATNANGFTSNYVTLTGPNVVLTQGNTYYVGALLESGTRDWQGYLNAGTDSAITFVNGCYAPPGGDGKTPQPWTNVEGQTYTGDANFQFTTPIAGDINADGLVDVADYNIWAANVGKTGATWSQGDLNGDGLVDVADYNIWAANVGKTAATPEPISMIILAVGGGLVALKRRK